MARINTFAEVHEVVGRVGVTTSSELTEEQCREAMRKICGARACQGAKDARIVLEALGLIPIIKE